MDTKSQIVILHISDLHFVWRGERASRKRGSTKGIAGSPEFSV
jgi:hypothetical protein